MIILRTLLALVLGLTMFGATPAAAQFFMKSHDFSGPPIRGDEGGVVIELPGATPDELRASLVWHLRAALNISALQCQFEPTLLTVPTYNSVLKDHRDELAKSFTTLTKYFARTAKTAKTGQTALDSFSTSVYGSFSTANAQFGFCQIASSVGRDAIFQPRGSLHDVARLRMREIRNAMIPWGEQRFPRGSQFNHRVLLPNLDPKCWNKDGTFNERRCGAALVMR